ncbi:RNA 3'-terminal phosphate cyclase-like protein-like [Scleropages formosus]|uniref:RNA 3'-terminal phosphate cyclase-like protein-like n=1 Tax=Scleropages formosus TaxID=113540 RepID=A0A0P7VF89_SCLFO|nr:RNA 3'-terminal phosphate cyclase-like protein-like [Scleropages formosus]
MASQGLTYEGCNFFRQRLVLSTLSGKWVKIKNIRSKDDSPGLQDFEASFIRLMDKITNGTRIEINQTGTVLYYQPGLLFGGQVEHECNPQRSIGYYLEALLMLAPFMKKPLRAVLRGVTNDQKDPSVSPAASASENNSSHCCICNTIHVHTVDTLKVTSIPLMKSFGIDGEGLELKIMKRGMPPGGGGEVLFTCPVRRTIRPVQLTDPGKIKRIRGTAYSVRVSPQIANRIVDSARSILNKFIPDIYIYTDHMKGGNAGKSPGFGLALVAESTNGMFLSAELASNPQGQGSPMLPEDLGCNCAKLLLEEVYRGGCVDSTNQSLALLYMTLGQQDVSKLLLGPLSPYTIWFLLSSRPNLADPGLLLSPLPSRREFLRHIRDFFQIMFKIEVQKQEDESRRGGDKVLMTCMGAGYANISKTLK